MNLLFCLKQDERFHVHLEPFAERIRWRRAERDAVIAQAVQRYADRLAARCLERRCNGSTSIPSGTHRTRVVTEPVIFGEHLLRIEDVLAVAQRRAPARLQADETFRSRITRGAQFLDTLLDREGVIYGVTTGYGDSCVVAVPLHQVEALPQHLFTFHGCGLGKLLDAEAIRAVLAARLRSLTHGMSGVRIELLERMQAFLEHDVLPLIPEEGSVGASGDLTPLSYVAAALAGEREVLYRGERRSAAEVHRQLGWTPLTLRPKEALALMNGTAVMTGLACLAYARADYLLQLATRITALNLIALQGNPEHFDERLFAAKPHPGRFRSPHGFVRTWPSMRPRRRCIDCRTATPSAARPMCSVLADSRACCASSSRPN